MIRISGSFVVCASKASSKNHFSDKVLKGREVRWKTFSISNGIINRRLKRVSIGGLTKEKVRVAPRLVM